MTQNIQISTKLNDGTILVIAGDTPEEFTYNASEMVGESAAAELKAQFLNLVPASGGYAYGAEQTVRQAFPQAQQVQEPAYAPRQGAGAPPGNVPNCPTHQQPAVWKEGGVSTSSGKPYNGFYKCAVTGSSISNFNGQGLKSSCPPAK